MDPRYAEIAEVMATYFDGLYHCDTKRLAQVLHENAIYVCATETPLLQLSMAEYLPIVAKRESPASRNEPRADAIDEITFGAPDMAFARVRCSAGPKDFIDFLTLVRTGGRWQIVSKVFHYDLRQA